MNTKIFTSESVTAGHPDKMCDIISDAILDACIQQDPNSRVACETVACTGYILVTGEITTKAVIDISSIVRNTILEIGYDDSRKGFDGKTCAVLVALDKQSPDIAQGVDESLESRLNETSYLSSCGAGDQGIMFGYATNKTDTYMPIPIDYAHKLAFKLSEVRKNGILPYLRPDGKTQVSVYFDKLGNLDKFGNIIVSTQHDPNIDQITIKNDVIKYVINPVVCDSLVEDVYVNPTGRFVIGGPQGDAGLTGRKIIVDTYGGWARHGGGCFSGKDPSKVDRSAAYAARYAAKNIVAAGFAEECEIQLSYAIGVAEPTSILINTFGTGTISEDEMIRRVKDTFDFTPLGMINMLDLLKPIYKHTAVYGHFGRTDKDFPWERLDKIQSLQR